VQTWLGCIVSWAAHRPVAVLILALAVTLAAGYAAATRIGIDSQRLHYQELTIKSTFHHTPESFRKSFRLIADGHIEPDSFITSEQPLERLPEALRRMAAGTDDLKTAILPWA